MRKPSGLNTQHGNITLKWRVLLGTNALDLYKWHADVSAGQVNAKRKKVEIVVQDETGADAARFVVSEAWPIKYVPTDLNTKENELLIELMELVNEGIERV